MRAEELFVHILPWKPEQFRDSKNALASPMPQSPNISFKFRSGQFSQAQDAREAIQETVSAFICIGFLDSVFGNDGCLTSQKHQRTRTHLSPWIRKFSRPISIRLKFNVTYSAQKSSQNPLPHRPRTPSHDYPSFARLRAPNNPAHCLHLFVF